MAFKVIPTTCPVCGHQFLAESYQTYLAKKAGRVPTCSKKCEQERRHQASRDKKWQAQVLRQVTESPK
jgi:hypothetical protein